MRHSPRSVIDEKVDSEKTKFKNFQSDLVHNIAVVALSILYKYDKLSFK